MNVNQNNFKILLEREHQPHLCNLAAARQAPACPTFLHRRSHDSGWHVTVQP